MPDNEVNILRDKMVEQLSPLKIYLFGSFAEGKQNERSDYDFYVIMRDGIYDMVSLTASAYKAIRNYQTRPVDIIIGTQSRFEERVNIPSVEYDVSRKGVVVYG